MNDWQGTSIHSLLEPPVPRADLHGGATVEAEGDFFQFSFYKDWHDGDLLLSAVNMHRVKILLDASIQFELRCGTVQRVANMVTGDFTLVPAECEAHWQWSGLNRECMHFQISERWLACQIADYPGTTIGHAEIALVPKHSDLFMLQVGLSLVEELRTSRSIANRLATESAALLLGLHLVRRYRRDPISAGASKRGGLAAWQLRRVKSAMETAENTFSLEELAAMIGISATHFCTAFRESTGLPPHKWQMQRRIERAKALLSDFRLSLTEIALACGYGSSSHFARSFRRATGMTPSEYRRAR